MIRYLCVVCICTAALAGIAAAGLYEPTVTATESSVTPTVLMPGDTGIITVTLKNTAQTSTATTSDSQITTQTDLNPTITSVFLDGRGDIEVLGGNSQFTGDLGPGQEITLSFLIRAPEEAGIYFPVLRVRVRGAEGLTYPVPVNVNMPIATLSTAMLVITQEENGYVVPGETIQRNVTVTNRGRSAADDIRIRIVDDNPYLGPLETGSFYLNTLAPEESEVITVSLITSRSLENSVQEIPLEISYAVVDGVPVTQTDSLTLDVHGHAELSIASVRTEPARISGGEPFDMTIRLENTGTDEAIATMAVIDLPFTGTKEAFIGKIKPNNDGPAVFSLDGGTGGDYPYTLTVTWEDDWGQHTESFDLTLAVKTENALTTFAGLLIILILAAGGAYYLLVYRKKSGQA
ncbi:COG1361 S-layer family protein [Methanogenium organophilum]|uniref:CARDB domain-containing protein n=1 Tax=Methanogenium organophilum TaxID=2199 RepID=A0A9X9S346_METOG|nr:CARDB domain-containing protein [Methanogenium organophilum]WAI00622.1 hypothetical protein OU421_09320 [Methanogenium organophilum]